MKTSYPILLFVAFIWVSCAPSLTSLAETNPQKVVAVQDSLLSANPNDKIIKIALVTAHLNIAQSSKSPENSYRNALNLDPNNVEAIYHLSMIEGHQLFKKGDESSLWESLESYAHSAALIDSLGEAFYWMGRVYEKKDNQDFELIIESYQKAISRELSHRLRKEAMQHLSRTKSREKTYKDFWK